MSYWNGEKIVSFPDRPCEDYPGWYCVDCGCCNGIEWGGETPEECTTCNGGGVIYRHKSGVLAQWPGGPFMGSIIKKETQ